MVKKKKKERKKCYFRALEIVLNYSSIKDQKSRQHLSTIIIFAGDLVKRKKFMRIFLCFPFVHLLCKGSLLFIINGFGEAFPAVWRNMLANESISLMDEELGFKSVPTDTNYFNMPLL